MEVLRSRPGPSKLSLYCEFEQLTENFDRLLRQAIRLTRTGDRIERQLVNMQKDLRDHIHKTEQLNRNLKQLDEEKNEFLNIISHELRSPLSGVYGILNLINEDDGSLPKASVNEMTSTAANAVERIMRLIETILDVNRIEKGQIELVSGPCDMSAIAKVFEQQFRVSADAKDITFEFEPPAGEIIARGDPDALHRVLENLLSNAIKYTPSGKRVWFHVREEAGSCICEVGDEGPGIPEAEQPKLFTKYARLSSRPTGDETSTGIGLAIAKGLAERMNARLWCESEVGVGSRFYLSLPLSDSAINS